MKRTSEVSSASEDEINECPLKKKCTEEEIKEISKKIPDYVYMDFVRYLGISNQEFLKNYTKCKEDSGFLYEMLMKWRKMNGTKATKDWLIEVLITIQQYEIARKIFPEMTDIGDNQNKYTREYFRIRDVLKDTKSKLKHLFTYLHLPRTLWLERKRLLIEELFVDFSLKQLYRHPFYVDITQEVPRAVELEGLFEEKPTTTPYRILVESLPFHGKTTFLLKYLSDWALEMEYVRKKFDLALIIPLKNLKKGVSAHILNQCRGNQGTDEEKMKAVESVEDRVLLLLDGLDEATPEMREDLLPLLMGDKYPKMTVIATSRTGYYHIPKDDFDCSIGVRSKRVDIQSIWNKRIFIKGLSPDNRKKYLAQYLTIEYEELDKILSKGKIQLDDDFFACPLFLLILAVVMKERPRKSVGFITQLYKTIFNFIVQRNLVRENRFHKDLFDIFDSNNSECLPFRKAFLHIAQLCLEKIKIRDVTFKKSEIEQYSDCDSDLVIRLGFFSKCISFSNHQEVEHYEPIHKNFLDLMAAFYVSTLDQKELIIAIESLLENDITPRNNQLFYPILAGLLQLEASRLFAALLSLKKDLVLLDTTSDGNSYPLEYMLREICPTEEVLPSLESLFPKHIWYDIDNNFPGVDFLNQWIGGLMTFFPDKAFYKEVKIKLELLLKLDFIDWIPHYFVILNLFLEIGNTNLYRIKFKGHSFQCQNLFISEKVKNFFKIALLLRELLSKFRTTAIHLKCDVLCSDFEFKREIQTFIRSCKEVIQESIYNINFHRLGTNFVHFFNYHFMSPVFEDYHQHRRFAFRVQLCLNAKLDLIRKSLNLLLDETFKYLLPVVIKFNYNEIFSVTFDLSNKTQGSSINLIGGYLRERSSQ